MISNFLTFASALVPLMLLPGASAADPSSCLSFGIDFQNNGVYFINSLSNDNFTLVSQFEHCKQDVAQVLLVDPKGNEYMCSDIPTTPDNTDELSTCPIKKSQMVSGDWVIAVFGNNAGGNPFAYQRDITLKVAPEVNVTITPTATFNVTVTPTNIHTIWYSTTETFTAGPTTTVTVASRTAHRTKTVTPAPVIVTKAITYTRRRTTFKKEVTRVTKTVTAICTTPAKPLNPDPTCTFRPTKVHPAAMEPTHASGHRPRDGNVDASILRRIDRALARREHINKLDVRAPDMPTLFITATQAVNTTITYTAAGTSTTESDFTTISVFTTQPPATVVHGVFTSTVTARPSTRTKHTVLFTTKFVTKTIHAKYTVTTTVTPKASASSCKAHGGHFPGQKR